MKHSVLLALSTLATLSAHAQLNVPVTTPRAVADSTMVFTDRGSRLEILPTSRAIPEGEATAVIRHRVVRAAADTPVNDKRLGVVFNHAMQQTGFFTGEIALKMKTGEAGPPAVEQGLRPKQIGKTGIYVIRATTPTQFMSVLKGLQVRNNLEWVEPTIIYGAHD